MRNVINKFSAHCKKYNVYFQKPCAVYAYLKYKTKPGEWVLFLDGDTGVVNPNHCIEEWIDDRVNLIFYERFMTWEIMSGNFFARNSKFTHEFLVNWSESQFLRPFALDKTSDKWDASNQDNGMLHIIILQAIFPNAKNEIKTCRAIYDGAYNMYIHVAYVNCVKFMLGSQRIWPGKIRLYRRAHGWARDAHLTAGKWSDNDFMMHDWKAKTMKEIWTALKDWCNVPKEGTSLNPFSAEFDLKKCGANNFKGWNWSPSYHISRDELAELLSNCEKEVQANYHPDSAKIPHVIQPDIRECYPNCEED